jgi:activator of HSP90 ATPase
MLLGMTMLTENALVKRQSNNGGRSMLESFEVSAVISASPAELYDAWLDGDRYSAMTGGEATGRLQFGAEHSAWGGYITGRNIELDHGRRILQSWRTTEFPEGSPDSLVEVILAEVGTGTKVTLRHSEIPDGRANSYETGWSEHYFEPMMTHFGQG